MRALGLFLLFAGLVALAAGAFVGCGGFFSWNGRHAISAVELGDEPITQRVAAEPGRRYTVSVQVVFERQGPKEGAQARMPLTVRVRDLSGSLLAEQIGWLDPAEPPTVLRGQYEPHVELVAERMIGPFLGPTGGAIEVGALLGADRESGEKATPVLARRLVVYDDALPPSVRVALAVGVAGALAGLGGAGLLLSGFLRRRGRGGPRRGGIRRRTVV